ncbi:hypothetical protein VPMG_00007 [Vibrio phage VBP32]|uniref:Uncharacterized protein n=2 Tax=Stoningtonvirus VBP47 TaxID=2846606 RepID=M4SL07_9CAUD|nr:hypothetical protein VPNG_00008 [Vibrio phage VBP47]YP_007676497.1 hypothetical protein VPMG_00007 [Vibrio phage VBP32]AGH57032.1 hypothetical protein VPNG_00008 [Vibrio phage VBP47]AGH57146.1 hypothetical protein VPMG_00007 [Vibrio phage VBP32]
MTTVKIEVEVDINVYGVTDGSGADVEFSFEVDNDGDVSVEIEGVVIDADEFELLEKAKSLTDDDWDLIATSNLIES